MDPNKPQPPVREILADGSSRTPDNAMSIRERLYPPVRTTKIRLTPWAFGECSPPRGTGGDDVNTRTRTEQITIMKHSDIQACPHVIMMPEHYRADGSCRCDDADHTIMVEWGYAWDGESWVSPDDDGEA